MSNHVDKIPLAYAKPAASSSIRRIWTTAWMITAVFILSNSPTPLYVHWQANMGFSNGMLTVIFAAYIIGLLGTLLVAGQLSDHYGRKPVLYPGLIAAVIACILFASAASVIMLVLARFLSGIAVGVIVSAGMAAVVDAGGTSNKPLSSLAASVAMVLGAGIGPLFAGILAQALEQPVLPIFIVELIVLASVFLVIRTLPQKRRSAQMGWRLRFPGVPVDNRIHLALGIVAFAPGITSTSFVLSLGPSLLSNLFHITSPLVAGVMTFIMFITATGVQFAAKKRSIRTILLLGILAIFLAMIGTAVAVNYSIAILLIVAAVLAGAGQGLGQLGGLTLISLHVPEERRAEANAVLNMGGYIPAALLPVGTGYLIDFTGLALGTTLFTIVLLIAAIAGALFVGIKLKQA
ncbi:MFS transporter [Paenibacillus sp. R14(2021)]|uniref:MFS transporter n=1 Tax=Paenibacillus sp. R14(2021) TaxID=2859228 RepID=UPI001C6142A5|nr:MFS transporter [Paenibacillus sp. R14(2021)]